jgi:hypothetical protein
VPIAGGVSGGALQVTTPSTGPPVSPPVVSLPLLPPVELTPSVVVPLVEVPSVEVLTAPLLPVAVGSVVVGSDVVGRPPVVGSPPVLVEELPVPVADGSTLVLSPQAWSEIAHATVATYRDLKCIARQGNRARLFCATATMQMGVVAVVLCTCTSR